jgi:hypothetical protein
VTGFKEHKRDNKIDDKVIHMLFTHKHFNICDKILIVGNILFRVLDKVIFVGERGEK